MTEIVKFNFQGNDVAFEHGKGVMVNATEMAKAFGKQPIDWLKTKQTKEFIASYSKLKNISLADLKVVKRGGYNAGTWLYNEIAMEFARYLSPEFAIWTNDRIKELIAKGRTELPDTKNKPVAIQSTNTNLTNIQDTAKQIGIGYQEFIEWLMKQHYIFTNYNNQIRPFVYYCPKYFVIGQEILITPEGKAHFEKEINQ